MDRPPAEELDEPVPGSLEQERLLDRRAVVAGELHGARVAEEVREVKQVDVEGVALDPLAAVEQAAQARTSGSISIPNRSSNAWTALI